MRGAEFFARTGVDDRRQIVHGEEPGRAGRHRDEDQHGAAKSICPGLPTEQQETRREMAENQGQDSSAAGIAAAHRLFTIWVLRSETVSEPRLLFFLHSS